MGNCQQSFFTKTITFIFDPRFFPVPKRTQKVPANTTIKSLCRELKSLMSPSFPRHAHSINLRFREKTYYHKDITLLSELFIKKGEKIFVHVVPKSKDFRLINVKIHCCKHSNICLSVSNESTISQLEDSISGLKGCCSNHSCKLLCDDLELRSDESCEFPPGHSLHALYQGQHLGCAPSPWKIKQPGLIQEGICMNQNCLAYKQSVCINKGLGKFNLVNENEIGEHRCTMCEQNLYNTKRFGFINCWYQYVAYGRDGGTQQETCTAGFTYCEFDLFKNFDWERLDVLVSKL
ncbi:unnamed protein product [Blepharisma stoltei]|uniref:Ubiquitin-like domain-containing protein n=1 Tax=Blepharisma stoltei TaxID=1481888 RepID=A0AAU9I9N8_9CILI|nr:unnamed protein product [Blepharisma stoltei]